MGLQGLKSHADKLRTNIVYATLFLICRSVRNQNRMLVNSQHNLIDGDLVWKYLSLTHSEQASVAKRMGTTPDQIAEDLLEIDRITTHF